MSIFFKELQRKRLVGKLKIDPNVDLKVPSSISSLVGPDPRDIDDETWLKLTWASLNLTDEDLRTLRVPPALVRALAVLWTHGGLRFDEVRRLTVGCTRAVKSGTRFKTETLEGEVADYVGLLDVPVSKTASASTKPVPLVVKEAILAWQQVRGDYPVMLDKKTSKLVDFLFVYRGRRIFSNFVNRKLIPLLCSKAGVPNSDGRGPFTWHRGRPTIATGLYNSVEGMSLDELRIWLGHRSMSSTFNYVRFNPLAQASRFAQMEAQNDLVELLREDEIEHLRVHNTPPNAFVEREDGSLCTNPEYKSCRHKDSCSGCLFYMNKDNPTSRLLKAQHLVQQLLDGSTLNEEDRSKLESVIELVS